LQIKIHDAFETKGTSVYSKTNVKMMMF